jgi:hypothetical protein
MSVFHRHQLDRIPEGGVSDSMDALQVVLDELLKCARKRAKRRFPGKSLDQIPGLHYEIAVEEELRHSIQGLLMMTRGEVQKDGG